MATLVASQAQSGIQPRAVHAGVNSVYSVYSLSATLSAGDIIQMCKLPDGARIVEVALTTTVNPLAAAVPYNVGTSGDVDKYIINATLSASLVFRLNATAGFGAVEDVSDDASTKYTVVQIEVGGSTTTGTKSGSISLLVQYQLDQ